MSRVCVGGRRRGQVCLVWSCRVCASLRDRIVGVWATCGMFGWVRLCGSFGRRRFLLESCTYIDDTKGGLR